MISSGRLNNANHCQRAEEEQRYHHNHTSRKPLVVGKRLETNIRSASSKLDLFVYKVDNNRDNEIVRDLLVSDDIAIHSFQKVSHNDAFSKSSRIVVGAVNKDRMFSENFRPDEIACRLFKGPRWVRN